MSSNDLSSRPAMVAGDSQAFGYHMVIARKQTLVQLSDELVDLLDREALRRGVSRSALIREAVEQHLHDEREAEIDRRIVEAYTRMPQTEEELEWDGTSACAGAQRQLDEEDDDDLVRRGEICTGSIVRIASLGRFASSRATRRSRYSPTSDSWRRRPDRRATSDTEVASRPRRRDAEVLRALARQLRRWCPSGCLAERITTLTPARMHQVCAGASDRYRLLSAARGRG